MKDVKGKESWDLIVLEPLGSQEAERKAGQPGGRGVRRGVRWLVMGTDDLQLTLPTIGAFLPSCPLSSLPTCLGKLPAPPPLQRL